MKMQRNTTRFSSLLATLAISALTAGVHGQNSPAVHGSLDAITVVPATQPAAAVVTTLPAGHVAIGGGGAQTVTDLHQGMAAAKTGAIRVIVSQGTKGGPAVGKDVARVDLLSQGVSIKTIMTAVDDKGIIELHDLPLEVAFQPVITILHAGSEQQRVGASMHKYQPAIEFDMPVFETTDKKPDWTIGLRDVEAQAVPGADGKGGIFVRFIDMVGAFSPSDRAWTGENGEIFSVALPGNAANVQFGPGMAEAGATFANGRVARGKTMLPGSTEYMFGYDIPVKDGNATVTFTSPADTTLFALYVPGDWKVTKVTGLELAAAGGAHATGKAQLIKGKALKPGTVVSLDLGGITLAPVAAGAPAEVLDHTTDLHLPAPGQK